MAERFEKIKLYAVSTCSHCKALQEFLQENGIAYDCVVVDDLLGKDRREMLKEVRKYNKRSSFPTVVVGERVVVGFKEDELREALAL